MSPTLVLFVIVCLLALSLASTTTLPLALIGCCYLILNIYGALHTDRPKWKNKAYILDNIRMFELDCKEERLILTLEFFFLLLNRCKWELRIMWWWMWITSHLSRMSLTQKPYLPSGMLFGRRIYQRESLLLDSSLVLIVSLFANFSDLLSQMFQLMLAVFFRNL